MAEEKAKDAYVVCSSIQSVSRNLELFKLDDFGYIIVDECHHGTADTYRKVLSYFKPEFTLGLTATPDRADGESILDVSGSMKSADRTRILDHYENGDIQVLCACDLLNEDWDSPKTEVLFMTRPTLSKTLYVQQQGRGMRKSAGKDYLMVFDFIDNAGLFNMPYSLHRMFNLKEYRAGEYVVASPKQFELDRDLISRGEKPSVCLDFPVNVEDYELIDLFNWQDEVKGMISQLEFVRMVDVQTETIERYLREGKITPDLEVPFGNKRSFKYFKEATVESYAKQYGWELINPANMKDKFIRWLSATKPLAA